MQMSKHTPGPWHLVNYKNAADYTICSMSHGFVTSFPKRDGIETANLIAAAPELLDLAKLILKEWDAPTEGVQRGELISRLSQYASEARKIITKAEGGDAQ